jgi:hypothetical protein
VDEAEAALLADRDSGRLPARRFLRRQHAAAGSQLVLVTPRDLSLAGYERLFGFADRRRRVAVVSTYRLRGGDEPNAALRVVKVIQHERGHLDGLSHCATAGCVMSQARTLAELDARSLERCARCRAPRSHWKARLVAVAVWALVFVALQAATGLVKVKKPPFSWRPGNGSSVVLYHARPVLTAATGEAAREATAALNRLYAKLEPPPIEAAPGPAGVVLRASGATVAVIDKSTAAGREPLLYAQDWATRMNWLMRAKGTEAEGCPDCHIRRLDEVEESARQRQRRRW